MKVLLSIPTPIYSVFKLHLFRSSGHEVFKVSHCALSLPVICLRHPSMCESREGVGLDPPTPK